MDKPMLIFDLDGTLWDSAPAVADAWNIVFAKADPSLPKLTTENVHSVMGMTMKEIGQVLQPALRDSLRESVFEECCRFEVEYLYTHSGTLYPKMRETLETLKAEGYRLAIVSNCQRGYVEAFLQSSGARDLFDDYEEWERTGLTKGENIRLVMRRNGAEEAIYIGDTRKDEEAANAAGVPFIHAAYGFGKAEKPATVINRLEDLTEAIRRIQDSEFRIQN